MFEVAKENGLGDRDELRKLPIVKQQELQKTASEKIAAHTEEIVIIDTHAFMGSLKDTILITRTCSQNYQTIKLCFSLCKT